MLLSFLLSGGLNYEGWHCFLYQEELQTTDPTVALTASETDPRSRSYPRGFWSLGQTVSSGWWSLLPLEGCGLAGCGKSRASQPGASRSSTASLRSPGVRLLFICVNTYPVRCPVPLLSSLL